MRGDPCDHIFCHVTLLVFSFFSLLFCATRPSQAAMLESKLKRRYTWPVELLGVIVEDGEVIIGTEEQIFPNGQINADFINLQHQQNLHLQGNCSTRPAPTGNTDDNHPVNKINRSVADCSKKFTISRKNEDLSESQVSPEHETSTLLNHCAASDKKKHVSSTNDNTNGPIECYATVYSPRIINISGKTEQVDHNFCTCNGNVSRTSGNSTNKHNYNNNQVASVINDVGTRDTFQNDVQNWKRPATRERFNSASSNGSRSGARCQNGYHGEHDDNPGYNEILQVQISSLYPVTEEEVFTAAIEPKSVNDADTAQLSSTANCKNNSGKISAPHKFPN